MKFRTYGCLLESVYLRPVKTKPDPAAEGYVLSSIEKDGQLGEETAEKVRPKQGNVDGRTQYSFNSCKAICRVSSHNTRSPRQVKLK